MFERAHIVEDGAGTELDEAGVGTRASVSALMSHPLTDTTIPPESIVFEPARSGFLGWGEQRREAVGEFATLVYNASGVQLRHTRRTEHLLEEAEEGEELLRHPEEARDRRPSRRRHSLSPPVQTQSGDAAPLSAEAYFGSGTVESGHVGRPLKQTVSTKAFKAQVWMCTDFPLKPQQLFPLLEIIANSQRHVARLQSFVESTLPPGFPVKVDVPVFPTVHAVATITSFKRDPLDDALFSAPTAYREASGISSVAQRAGNVAV